MISSVNFTFNWAVSYAHTLDIPIEGENGGTPNEATFYWNPQVAIWSLDKSPFKMWISYRVYQEEASVKAYLSKGNSRVSILDKEIEGKNPKYSFTTFADHFWLDGSPHVLILSGFSKEFDLWGVLSINSSKPINY